MSWAGYTHGIASQHPLTLWLLVHPLTSRHLAGLGPNRTIYAVRGYFGVSLGMVTHVTTPQWNTQQFLLVISTIHMSYI